MNRASNPLYPLVVFISLVLTAYGVRLYTVQVVQHAEYETQSDRNHFNIVPIRALRGEVLASDGKTKLITNRVAWDLVYTGGEEPVKYWDRIARIAGVTGALPALKPGEQKVIAANLPENDGRVVALAEWIAGQPALSLTERVERVYPTHSSGNLYGYTLPAGPDDAGYLLDDLKGASGVEAGFEKYLRGRNGFKYIEVDSQGHAVNERIEQEAIPGHTVTLSINARLQKAAEDAIEKAKTGLNARLVINGQKPMPQARGAIVALDPHTGQVLAMANGPRFDPNILSVSPRPPEFQAFALDKEHLLPQWPRAIKAYEPGSTFKILTSSAIIEKYGNQVYTCMGYVYYGRIFRNWESRNRGPLDVRGAIANSCDTWYYQAAIQFGPTSLAETIAARARQLGFGSKTGIELPNEDPGWVASPEAYNKLYGDGFWQPGDGLSLAIGQLTRATPVQIARMAATVVNDGMMPQLTLLQAVDGKPVPPKPMIKVPGKDWELLREGMRQTVVAGTATPILGSSWGVTHFPVPTAGKTGSAQVGGEYDLANGWYVGFAPYDHPKIVVVAFFENSDEGYYVALPAVKRMFAAYFGVPLDDKGNFLKDKYNPKVAEAKP
ncbi:MAG TPA: penicillin-binding transpeptidase domain-containing protein [Deinococcales bacterium]|nr:penicillin-binding transpeptidase domain-containing protein [Deinococcales bacterium]